MPLSKETPHKISTLSAKRFQRRRSWKVLLNFDISMTLGQGKEMTLILINYNFINESISCLHLATFMYRAAIVYKMSIAFAFSHVKAYVSKIYLAIK